MRYLVNGVECELDSSGSGAEITVLSDRMVVRTREGVHTALAVRVGNKSLVSYRGMTYEIEPATVKRRKKEDATHSGNCYAIMPGQVVSVLVSEGANVEKGGKLMVLEAMKTQHPVLAPISGKVERLLVTVGEQVHEGQLMAIVSSSD